MGDMQAVYETAGAQLAERGRKVVEAGYSPALSESVRQVIHI